MYRIEVSRVDAVNRLEGNSPPPPHQPLSYRLARSRENQKSLRASETDASFLLQEEWASVSASPFK